MVIPGERRPALILDFGGVVTTEFRGALAAFCTRNGLAPAALATALHTDETVLAALSAAECGRITQPAFEAVLGQSLGVEAAGVIRSIAAELGPSAPMLDLVAEARAAGMPTAILSNSFGAGGHDLYAGYDLDLLFDTVVISDQVGMRKPDEDIYLLTVERLGVAPERCVFVDDTAVNLPPAKALGMAVVHFTEVESGIAQIAALLGLR